MVHYGESSQGQRVHRGDKDKEYIVGTRTKSTPGGRLRMTKEPQRVLTWTKGTLRRLITRTKGTTPGSPDKDKRYIAFNTKFELSASIPTLEQRLSICPISWQLRSASDARTFVTPRVNTKTFAERTFSYAGPSVWNNLPQTLHHSDSTSSFKAALKTHLFNNYF